LFQLFKIINIILEWLKEKSNIIGWTNVVEKIDEAIETINQIDN